MAIERRWSFRQSESGYTMVDEISLDGLGGVVQDLNLRSGDAIINARGDLFASCYSYNIWTKKRKRLGWEPNAARFLQPEVVKSLNGL